MQVTKRFLFFDLIGKQSEFGLKLNTWFPIHNVLIVLMYCIDCIILIVLMKCIDSGYYVITDPTVKFKFCKANNTHGKNSSLNNTTAY